MPRKKSTTPDGVTARALAEEIGISRETFFAWIARGLLPTVPFRGARTRYGAVHRLRATVIAKLRGEGVPFDDLEALLAVDDAVLAARHGLAPTSESPAAGSFPLLAGAAGAMWQRVELLPGLELHLSSSSSAFVCRVAEEVVARYRAASR